jgi:ubiquinone/menaquinone biosynthesis C-methylase UbiE
MRRLNTKEDVYGLLYASAASAALGTAVETGLLWMLAEKPLDGATVAQTLNIPNKRCQYWLQFLHSLGILENNSGGVAPSALVREAILDVYSRESWQYLTLEERKRTAGVRNLPLYISEPSSIWAAQGLPEPKDYVEEMRANPASAREFTRMLFEVHQHLANQIAELLDMTGVRRMIDLGGGSGVVSMALLRKYPALTATVVDIENVCLAGREIAEEEELSDRISYYPSDFATGEFPAGFDLVLQCDVGVYFMVLYQKLWRSLKPGGRLIFVEHFSSAENSAPTTRLEWTFLDSLHNPDFCFLPTFAQVKAQLAEIGFEILPDQHLHSFGWTVLQARKGMTS